MKIMIKPNLMWKETMNRRLEWFISSVFDHYFGEAANGKYDGLFYGWDVVNEAVIGNSYRTDTVSAAESLDEIRHGNNSSWWHVYRATNLSSMPSDMQTSMHRKM